MLRLSETRYPTLQRRNIFTSLTSLRLWKDDKDAKRRTGRFPDARPTSFDCRRIARRALTTGMRSSRLAVVVVTAERFEVIEVSWSCVERCRSSFFRLYASGRICFLISWSSFVRSVAPFWMSVRALPGTLNTPFVLCSYSEVGAVIVKSYLLNFCSESRNNRTGLTKTSLRLLIS